MSADDTGYRSNCLCNTSVMKHVTEYGKPDHKVKLASGAVLSPVH